MAQHEGSATRHLLLIKHALPTITPTIAPAHWPLSAAGRQGAAALAEHLAPYALSAIVTSDELKAQETATILAETLQRPIPLISDHDLREHSRRPDDFFDRPEDFQAAIAQLFAQPDQLVFGLETATAACQRFTAAVNRHLIATAIGDLAIVAHGTVISLFVAAQTRTAPYPLWQRLSLPSLVVLRGSDLQFEQIIATIAPARSHSSDGK